MAGAIQIANELEDFTSRMAATVARRTIINLRNSTPKLSGYAASNWIGALGRVATAPVGSKQGVTFGPQNAGISEVLKYKISKTPAPVISNAVVYIDVLNSGSSTQAPPGFVEEALAKAIRDTAGASAR